MGWEKEGSVGTSVVRSAGSAACFLDVAMHRASRGWAEDDDIEGRRQRRFAHCRPASRAKEAAIAG